MMLLHVLAGRHAVNALKEGGEGGGVGEAAGVDDLGDVHILRGEQVGCLLQAQGTDEIVGRLARELLHLTVQVDAADAYLIGNHIDAEVGIVQLLVDGGHDALEQLLVGRLDLHLLHLFLELIGAAVFLAQQRTGVDKVSDGAA